MSSRSRVALVTLAIVVSTVAVAAPATGHQTVFALDATVDPAQPATGENVTVTVTLDSLAADGESTRVTDLALYNGTGDDAEELDSLDTNDWVRGGGTGSWDLHAELDATGERDLRVEVKTISQSGEPTTLERTVPVTVVDPHPAIAVSTDPVGPSGRTDVTLTLANGANVNVTGLDVEVTSPDVTLSESRRVVSSLAPGGEKSVVFPATDVAAGAIAVDADVSYTTASGEHRRYARSLSAHVDPVANPANVTLTGVRLSQEGRTIVVRGSASNPGETNATGAVIRAATGQHVVPGESQASFFVGDVEASDFASFEVHSRLASDVNGTVEIPLEIEYGVDGDRVTRETTLRYTVSDGANEPATQSGGLPLGLVGLLVVVGLAVVGWRRYRG